MSIFRDMMTRVSDACFVWAQEMKQVFKDEGVLIFFVIVPLVYPLLYSWIYNNEVVREIPVVVVDQSHSSLSRQFIRHCDASPDVKVAYYAEDLEEGKSLVSRQLAKGVYFIPSDFATNINRMQQAVVSVYCDMGLMLTYKALYITAQSVSQAMGAEIQTKWSGHYTNREDEIQKQPLAYESVALYNPSGGYGSFILPGVLILILQQTLVLGIGMSAGTARERNRYHNLIPIDRHYQSVGSILGGKALAYFMIYMIMAVYLTMCVPRFFSFPMLANWQSLACVLLPYILACIFFGMSVSCLVRYRENVMLIMVFVSLPLLFLTGISWPQSSIPAVWKGISLLFPSTFGVRAYVRLNSMGAPIGDVAWELRCLWIQAAAYFGLACIVYGYQVKLSRHHALERLEHMGRKEQVREWIKKRKSPAV